LGGIVHASELPEPARFMDRGIDFGLTLFDYKAYSIKEIKKRFSPKPKEIASQNNSTESLLIGPEQTDCFSVNKITVMESFTDKHSDSFYIGIVTKGQGTVSWNNQKQDIKFGDKFFKPFDLSEVIYKSQNSEELEILKIMPPAV